tara:strand:+ start:8061 stop:9107 length:1047 start_codon:yes stop_codon:yes gene_type:complete
MANPKGNYKGSIKASGIQKQVVLPDGLEQQIQQPYIQKGLTYKSNNKFVMNRDDAGNIILDPGSNNTATIQNLIIEPSIERILNKSVVEVFDTQFNYFKFPAKSKSDGSNLGFDDLNLDIENQTVDLISGHYVAPEQEGTGGYPSVMRKLPTSYSSTWDGRYGPQRVLFTTAQNGPSQVTPGTFTLLPDMIEQVKSSNNVVKFTVILNCRRDWGNILNTGMQMSIQRTMPTFYRSNNKAAADATFDIYNMSAPPTVYQTTDDYGDWIELQLEYIIDPTDMFDYDKYEILGVSGGESWWDGSLSYWNIQVIPDPGPGNYGIQFPPLNGTDGLLKSSLLQHQNFDASNLN